MQSLAAFLFFFGDKGIAFKSFLDLYFHLPLLSSESRKRYPLRLLLLMCLEALEKGFSFFPVRLG